MRLIKKFLLTTAPHLQYVASILIPVIHMIKLRLSFKGCQGQRERLLNLSSYNLYRFRIHRTSNIVITISQRKTVGQGDRR